MKIILTAILLLLIFSGCSSQKVVVKKELLCYDLQEVSSSSNDVKVRVYKDDLELFEARRYELKSIIEFHNKQIQKYKFECEK